MNILKKNKLVMSLFLTMLFVLSSQITILAKIEENIEEIDLSALLKTPIEVEKVPLTPEGNLTLVDDVTTNNIEDKQFITAVSKNGNFFYLVIDRANDKDNVYLLNLVDEADLMALIEDEKVTIKEEPQEEIIIPTPIVEEVIEVKEPIKEKNSTLPALITVVVLVGGGAFYYLKYVKGSIGNSGNSDLSEFDDDDFDDFDNENDEIEYEVEEDLIDKLEDYENESL